MARRASRTRRAWAASLSRVCWCCAANSASWRAVGYMVGILSCLQACLCGQDAAGAGGDGTGVDRTVHAHDGLQQEEEGEQPERGSPAAVALVIEVDGEE